jgi:hypothetical protein
VLHFLRNDMQGKGHDPTRCRLLFLFQAPADAGLFRNEAKKRHGRSCHAVRL